MLFPFPFFFFFFFPFAVALDGEGGTEGTGMGAGAGGAVCCVRDGKGFVAALLAFGTVILRDLHDPKNLGDKLRPIRG